MIPVRLESRAREMEDFLRQDPVVVEGPREGEEVLKRVTIDFEHRTVVEQPVRQP